ncbi:MAG: hypothetical protein IIV04_06280 [Bacteroidaceae bacterium]|nr:hypothetical protein [Bacteroidaceae bacterium]
MKNCKKILHICLKSLYAILLVALMAVVATSGSYIYDFAEPEPFKGPDIFNPYRNIDTTHCWKKANFHTHTRVEGIFNECKYWPEDVYKVYERLGYDIVTFSNHNELTKHPFSEELQVNVYEHGYNLLKFHKLTFGSKETNHFGHLLPVLPSQMQFQLDKLDEESDIIQFNHPLHTFSVTKEVMEKVCGYDIIEIDCEKSTECEYWDWALSAGRYSFALAGDDLHNPDDTHRVAKRCSFICSPTARYDDIKKVLLEGCYYSMKVPDYGNGNWEIKREKNHNMPYIKEIGLNGDTIFIGLSHVADSIKVIGQGHATLLLAKECNYAEYVMKSEDPYARFTVYFPTGEVIFSNPFARYDASKATSPVKSDLCSVNIPLTVLFNTALLALLSLLVFTFYKTVIKR